MPLSKGAKDAIFDIILKDALIESSNKEIDEINSQTEKHDFSKNFEKTIKHIKSSVGRKDIIMTTSKGAAKVLVTAAAVMGILFSGLLTVPSVNAAVMNVIRTVFNTHDEYKFNGNEISSDEFDRNKQFGYIPDGYELRSAYYFVSYVNLVYENMSEETEIRFNYKLAPSTIQNYDNENNEYTIITINGQEYYFYETNNIDVPSQLMWYKEGYSYGIISQLSFDELVKIAENIK